MVEITFEIEWDVKKMLAEQRHAKILEAVQQTGVARTAELARMLHASSETVRKDLEHLDKLGRLTRVHGGAVSRDGPQSHGPKRYVAYEERQMQNTERKAAIARRAAELVTEGQSVALDAGTSAFELAKVLKERFQQLTIVTNSLKNAVELVDKPGFTVIVTGGILMPDEYSFVSEFASMIFSRINLDLLFLTASGISPEAGITDQRVDEIRIQNKMRGVSRRTVVLADSSKFGKASLVRVCGLTEVDTIITDSGVDRDMASQLTECGCSLLIV